MLKQLSLLVAASLLAACGSDPAPEAAPEPAPEPAPEASAEPEVAAEAPTSGEDAYKAAAQELVTALDGDADAAKVGELAEGLTELGLSLVADLKTKHPVCAGYLDALVAAAPTMKDLTLEAIEADYHADGKLPDMPDKVCYHGKDLVVHPATVSVLARSGLSDRAAAKAEITEVLAHLDEVEGAGEEKAEDAATGTLVVEANDAMQFNVSELRAVAGQPITIELKHVGKFEKKIMGHNLVVLAAGVDMGKFAMVAAQAKDTDYIPAELKDQVLAHTKLLGGGEADTITFTVAEAGTYDFLCSFPGHSTIMKGKLVVTDAGADQ